MTEEKTTQTSPGSPVFRLQKLYLKDLSFENPNAPEVFFDKESEPKVDVNLNVKNRQLDEDHWEVTLIITATVTDVKTGKTLFILEIEHAGAFMLKDIPEQHFPMVLAVECPTLMFPFTRQIISQASVDGGFMPFLMEPVNFLMLYENSKKKQQAENEKQN